MPDNFIFNWEQADKNAKILKTNEVKLNTICENFSLLTFCSWKKTLKLSQIMYGVPIFTEHGYATDARITHYSFIQFCKLPEMFHV